MQNDIIDLFDGMFEEDSVNTTKQEPQKASPKVEAPKVEAQGGSDLPIAC